MVAQWTRLRAFEPGARSGDDPEDLHKMRVAARRLRAAAKVFGRAVERAAGTGFIAAAEADLRAVAAALGEVRDRDVAIDQVGAYAARAGESDGPALARLAAAWRAHRDAARTTLPGVLDGALPGLEARLVPSLRAIAALPVDTGARRVSKPVRKAAPKVVARALRRLRRRAGDLLAPAAADYHRIRLDAKRLRYTTEFFAPAFGPGVEPFVQRVTEIQDALGILHDADVAEGTLLGEIQRAANDADTSGDGVGDAGPLARFLEDYRRRRAGALDRFRLAWIDLPRPKAIRCQLQQMYDEHEERETSDG
jgi:CHAD domain-containing protein